MSELRYREEWSGDYRGITFLISKHTKYNGAPAWCFYLLVATEAIPESVREKWYLEPVEGYMGRPEYKYTESAWADLAWHYGITYYEPITNGVKVGCDYNHYWDEGHTYGIEGIEQEVEECINSLHNLLPVRYRSHWDGKWFDTEEEMKQHNEERRLAR